MKREQILLALIQRYDFSGAYKIASIYDEGLAYVHMLDLMRYSVNFDFKKAHDVLTEHGDLFPLRLASKLEKNLLDLIYGEPNAIFSELLWNMRFQSVQEEYIDLLGRMYRFNEAFLKYLFLKDHQGVHTVFDDNFSEGKINRILKKRFNIHHGNVIFAIVNYIYHYSKTPSYKLCADFITDGKMKALVDLRNASIVGHGFNSVGYDDLLKAYGTSEKLLDDIENIMEKAGLKIDKEKYNVINTYLIEEVTRVYDDSI